MLEKISINVVGKVPGTYRNIQTNLRLSSLFFDISENYISSRRITNQHFKPTARESRSVLTIILTTEL